MIQKKGECVMYESKYAKYIINNENRFATEEEVISSCKPIKKGTDRYYAGAPLLYKNETLYVDDSDSHYLIEGKTGSKKTRIQTIIAIYSMLSAGECIVVNDPKGEIYRKTAGFAKKCEYNIKVLNLRNLKKSNGWNPLSLPYRLDVSGEAEHAEEMINDFVSTLTDPIKANTKDNYWPVRVNSYLYSNTRLLMDSVTEENFNIANIIQLFRKRNRSNLEALIQGCDESLPFIGSLESFLTLSAEKTSDCLYDTVEQAFDPYSKNLSLLSILCDNDIEFSELVTKKTIFYIIYPDEKNTMAFISNLFLTQCYYYLIYHIESQELTKLDNRVNFVLDEFGNLPEIDGFQNRISEARGYNIRYFLYIQSFGQLKNTYKDNADTIKANCEWIVFSSKDISFLREVSDFCGDIRDYHGNIRPLLGVDKIQHLKKYDDGAETVIVRSDLYPYIAKLPDYEYLDIFEKTDELLLEEVKHDMTGKTLTFTQWLAGIENEDFNYPFHKIKRTSDRRLNKKTEKSTKKDKKEDSDDLQKRLEEKFDELFGVVADV